MVLRSNRRNAVVWRSSPGQPALGLSRPALSRRIRWYVHTAGLLAAIGLLRLAAAVRPRWRPLLAGVALTTAGVILRGGMPGMVMIPGMLFLLAALLTPAEPEDARARHRELERELAAYTTAAQRFDLEATFDRYPDADTRELRDILARQASAAARR